MDAFDLDRQHMNSAEIGLAALMDALERQTDNAYLDLTEDVTPESPLCWPSTLDYVDRHCGGYYGMTTLAAEPGTGKTTLGFASLIEAAASGCWQSVLFAAEDDVEGMRERFNLYCEAFPHALDCIGNLHIIPVGKGQTPESLTLEVCHVVNRGIDTPILIGLDSVNSIVNLNEDMPYLSGIARYGLWAMLARRLSRGRVSFLVTSETNQKGEAKGANWSFWSDVYIKMKKKSEDVVEMTLGKTRRTGGSGPMGKYIRIWHQQRFEPEPREFKPQLVANGAEDGWDLP